MKSPGVRRARRVAALGESGVVDFGIQVDSAGEYPPKLRDVRNPVEILYHQGWWSLLESLMAAVDGSADGVRGGQATDLEVGEAPGRDGLDDRLGVGRRHRHRGSSRRDGLGGPHHRLIGTPLGGVYPPENAALQHEIAHNFLLVSQILILRYRQASWKQRRGPFQSGTPRCRHSQARPSSSRRAIPPAHSTRARAALFQGRKLFILETVFHVPGTTWPHRFEQMGAIRARDSEEILQALRRRTRIDEQYRRSYSTS